MIQNKACDVGSAKIIPATVIGCCVSYVLPIFIVVYFSIDSVHILLNLKASLRKHNAVHPSIITTHKRHSTSTDADINVLTSDETTVAECNESCQSVPKVTSKNIRQSTRPRNTLKIVSKDTLQNIFTIKNNRITSLNNDKKGGPAVVSNGCSLKVPDKTLSDYQWIATFNVLLGVSFVINILPFGVLAVVRSICLDISGKSCVTTEWWYFGYIMCYLNSFLNPLCYAFGNKNFKRAFKSILCAEKSHENSAATSSTVTNNPVARF